MNEIEARPKINVKYGLWNRISLPFFQKWPFLVKFSSAKPVKPLQPSTLVDLRLV